MTAEDVASASPHTRGWTRAAQSKQRGQRGFPAHAGMDPNLALRVRLRLGLPRTTRGWTPAAGPEVCELVGFPAHAGMDPSAISPPPRRPWLPRTRGDGPAAWTRVPAGTVASPHTRGWTLGRPRVEMFQAGFPAHAGMDPCWSWIPDRSKRLPRTRGDGPCQAGAPPDPIRASPHTRGWTAWTADRGRSRPGFPAHAGMDPCRGSRAAGGTGLPRTRGDGPASRPQLSEGHRASPHTRGWTLGDVELHLARLGFPAHAGMDPVVTSRASPAERLPRTRGDGPRLLRAVGELVEVSPHTRGWTLADAHLPVRRRGFPAHAGMDPRPAWRATPTTGLPRTRGDGPRLGDLPLRLLRASPHTRGWTCA